MCTFSTGGQFGLHVKHKCTREQSKLDCLPCRNLLLCGSMDRLSFLLDLDSPDNPLVQKFHDHAKYVHLVPLTTGLFPCISLSLTLFGLARKAMATATLCNSSN